MFYATPEQKANAAMYGQFGHDNAPSKSDIASAANRDQAIRNNVANETVAGAALAGGVALAGPFVGGEAWAAYREAVAGYSSGAALGTGMVIGGGTYTGGAALSAVIDQTFGSGQTFSAGFDERFSYPGLAAAMTVGGLTNVYSTAMFGWAEVPNSIKNIVTWPGFVIRVNSGVAGKAAGSAAQSAVNSSANQK